MNLPPFYLPSAPLTGEIIFHSPTVTDAMDYIDIDEQETESVTTKYLNALQVTPLRDCREWTQQDRRTALLWIYSHSREDAIMTYSYECGHCEKIHHADVDMRDLLEKIELLVVPCEITATIPVDGVPVNWRLVPLYGWAAEILERLHHRLPDEEHPEYKKVLTELRFTELGLMTRRESDSEDPETREDAAVKRIEMIKKMSLGHEFPALVARIRQMNRDLRHGPEMTVEKDGVRLILPPQVCKTRIQEDPQPYTVLRAPFRNTEFIARVRPEWMVNHD